MNRIQQLRERLAQIDWEMAQLESTHPIGGVEPDHRAGARNLLHYVALRRHDIRQLQTDLAELGLSSLGRTESHVRASVATVMRVLTHLAAGHQTPLPAQHLGDGPSLHEGRRTLDRNTEALLGPAPEGRRVRIMVTMPPQAADNDTLVRDLLASGMNCMRINCAHDSPADWARMIAHLRRAEEDTGARCKVQMDLAGPKLRTGPIAPGPAVARFRPERDEFGRAVKPARVWLTPLDAPEPPPGEAQCTLPFCDSWLRLLEAGSIVRFTDSRGARREIRIAERVGASCWGEAVKTAYVAPGMEFHLMRPGRRSSAGELGPLPLRSRTILLRRGEELILTRTLDPGHPATRDAPGKVVEPARIGVSLPEFFDSVRPGEPVWFDDGKIGGVLTKVNAETAVVRITHARAEGEKLAAEKGINIPETDLRVPSLTEDDLRVLPFVANHADIAGLSFVRSPGDVIRMRQELALLGCPNLSLMLKIETRHGFENLPPILLEAMRGPAVGLMIARGDLAVECGFERLAEVQEEILWIAESAFVPVVWATQVLETLARTGLPSRSEITDAAMGERAECVMLNKGPYIVEAVKMLDNILRRMETHQEKKTARLRQLHVATAFTSC
ncbi:MAG: pyruvate kinase [Bryobacteraceae bacterium]